MLEGSGKEGSLDAPLMCRRILRPFEKWPISSRLKSTKTGQTRFLLLRSHIDSKNYEI